MQHVVMCGSLDVGLTVLSLVGVQTCKSWQDSSPWELRVRGMSLTSLPNTLSNRRGCPAAAKNYE